MVWLSNGIVPIVADEACMKAVETQDKSPMRSTLADGLRTLEVTFAINQSISTHELIRLPLA